MISDQISCLWNKNTRSWSQNPGSGSIKLFLLGGCRPPDPPLFLGGFHPPRSPGGGPAAPRAPPHTERLRLSGSLFFFWYQDPGTRIKIFVPRCWYQDLGTMILVPRSWYKDLGTTISSSGTRGPQIKIRDVFESLPPEYFFYTVLHHCSRRTTFGKNIPNE